MIESKLFLILINKWYLFFLNECYIKHPMENLFLLSLNLFSFVLLLTDIIQMGTFLLYQISFCSKGNNRAMFGKSIGNSGNCIGWLGEHSIWLHIVLLVLCVFTHFQPPRKCCGSKVYILFGWWWYVTDQWWTGQLAKSIHIWHADLNWFPNYIANDIIR